jgi:DNA-binding response OmpR family regulator
VIEAPLILVVEDDYPLQGVVEDFLREGGFVPSYRFVAGPVRMSDQTD